MGAFHNIVTITKKELKGYFNSPLAYVLIVVYLLFAMVFTFQFGGLLEIQNASLGAFFQYQPWLFMIFAPALGMRLWSEEQRLGTMELLMTMPISPWHAIVGKFLAASAVLFVSLALTFPVWITVNWLGNPDNGIIIAAYIATFLSAVTFLAITGVISALTRSQVVCFIIAVTICFAMVVAGFPPIVDLLNSTELGELLGSLRWWILVPFLVFLVFTILSFTGSLPGFGSRIGSFLILPTALFFLFFLGGIPPLKGVLNTLRLGETIAPFSALTHFIEFTKGILVSTDLLYYVSVIGFCLYLTAVVLKTKRA